MSLALLLAVSCSTAVFAQSEEAPSAANTMSIAGQGEFWVVPEMAEFSGSVVTKGDTLAEARDAHPAIAQQVRAAVDGLAQSGLRLETAQYSIREIDLCGGGFRVLRDGEECTEKPYFVATTKFDMSTANLAGLESIISTLAEGDLLVENIHFTVKNKRIPLLEARKDAARDALEQATAYAEALGVDLVDISNVTDGDASPPDYGEADLAIPTTRDGRIPLSIAIPAQLEYNASVRVNWTIGRPAS
ncbi:MAG: hypothetical protein JWP26_3489 [Devosia sp.]|nr:hypothetical protein [Devosia sp.]